MEHDTYGLTPGDPEEYDLNPGKVTITPLWDEYEIVESIVEWDADAMEGEAGTSRCPSAELASWLHGLWPAYKWRSGFLRDGSFQVAGYPTPQDAMRADAEDIS